MSHINLIHNHRSIRAFKNEELDETLITNLCQSALRASSSGNMQAYSIVITRDKKLREKLYKAHFSQDMVLEAPVVVTFCADFNRMKKWLAINKAPQNFDNFMSFLIGMIDATLASQNMALAAEAEGLGICYMGTTLANCHEVGKILNLPQNVFPVVGFVLGVPAEIPELRDRLPLEGMLHFETYKDYSDEDINRIYFERGTKGMQRYKQNPELKEKINAECIENLAQVYTKLKYTRESHVIYSNIVESYLHEQNFMRNS